MTILMRQRTSAWKDRFGHINKESEMHLGYAKAATASS